MFISKDKNDDIIVDKTGLIAYTNSYISKFDKYICVSRPRRFGKSYAADMLTAYYSRGCDSRALFEVLNIAKNANLTYKLAEQMDEKYPHIAFKKQGSDFDVRENLRKTGIGFNFIIDEWDCPFRERRNEKDSQNLYLQFLKDMFKNRDYISLVYMTEILPIKKYMTGSALNMFYE